MTQTSYRRVGLGVAALLALAGIGYGAARLLNSGGTVAKESSRTPWLQARRAVDAFDYEAAREALTRCRELWPLNAEVQFVLARVSRQLEDVPAWQRYLHAAEVLQWPREQIELERLLMRAQSGDVWSVEAKLRADATAWHPDEVWIVDALVRGYLKVYRMDDAKAWTRFWLERHPDDWRPHLYRGNMYRLIQSSAGAAAEFSEALKVRPDLPQAQFGLGGALMMESQFAEAVPHLEDFLRHKPNDPSALMCLANCQFSLNQLDAARATLDRLRAIREDDPAGCLLRGKLELAQDSADQALPWLRRADRLAPKRADILTNLASALRQLGKNTEAEQTERQLAEVGRQNVELENARMQILKEPADAALRFEAGRLCRDLGREDEARGWFQSVLALDPGHAAARRELEQITKAVKSGER